MLYQLESPDIRAAVAFLSRVTFLFIRERCIVKVPSLALSLPGQSNSVINLDFYDANLANGCYTELIKALEMLAHHFGGRRFRGTKP